MMSTPCDQRIITWTSADTVSPIPPDGGYPVPLHYAPPTVDPIAIPVDGWTIDRPRTFTQEQMEAVGRAADAMAKVLHELSTSLKQARADGVGFISILEGNVCHEKIKKALKLYEAAIAALEENSADGKHKSI